MRRVMLYSLLLIMGMGLSQLELFQDYGAAIIALTVIFLAYIMIEVGVEFDIDKTRLASYGVDYCISLSIYV